MLRSNINKLISVWFLSAIVFAFTPLIHYNSTATLPGSSYSIYWFGDVMLLLPKGFEVVNFYQFPKNTYLRSLNSLDMKNLFMYLQQFKLNYDIPKYLSILGKYVPLTTINDINVFLNVTSFINYTGVEGEGVVVGIIDTGVDFASPSLGLDKVARDKEGRPLTLDADQLGLAITPLEVKAVGGELQTAGKYVWVYVPFYGLVEVKIRYNFGAPKVNSTSGVYKFGLAIIFILLSNYLLDFEGIIIGLGVPIVLVDSAKPYVYNTVVADLSTAWFMLEALLYGFGVAPSPPSIYYLDLSFRDEFPASYGNELIARDFNGDGVYDLSIGIISGYVYDALGIIGLVKAERVVSDWGKAWEYVGSGIYPGLDGQGRYVSFIYDPLGHGTGVANIIVGKGFNYTISTRFGTFNYQHKGVAPKAKLAVATALYLGNVVTSLLWLSGHDYSYPWRWVFSGKPRVDIISNSWGIVLWDALLIFADKQFAPGYDPVTAFEEYITELGVLVIHASGNSGPAKLTVLPPSTAPNVISVGATTSLLKPIVNFRGEILIREGYNDIVISWSSRGPHIINVKPDIVAPGAYAIVPTVISSGLGDGRRSIDVFGGTSMAAPIVAGIAALLTSYTKKIGIYEPSLIRKALLYGALNLNFSISSSGWGRVNILKSLELIRNKNKLIQIVNYEYFGLNKLFEINNLKFKGLYESNVVRVRVNETKSIKFIKGEISNASVLELRKISDEYVGMAVAKPRKYTYIVIDKDLVEGDVVKVYVRYSLKHLDPYLSKGIYSPQYMIIPVLYDWVDLNNDSVVNDNELYLINHGIVGTPVEMLEFTPSILKGQPVVAVKALGNYTVPVKVYVSNYKWVNSSWVKTLVKNNSLWISVEAFIDPGIYEFKLFLRRSKFSFVIPLIVEVSSVINKRKLTFNVRTLLPSSYTSYANGETIVIPFEVLEPSDVAGLVIEAKLLTRISSFSLTVYGRKNNETILLGNFMGIPPGLTYFIKGLIKPYPAFNKYVFMVPSTTRKFYLFITNEIPSETLYSKILISIYPVIISKRGNTISIWCEYPLGLVEVNEKVLKHVGGNITFNVSQGSLTIKLRDIPSHYVASYVLGKKIMFIKEDGRLRIWLGVPPLPHIRSAIMYILSEVEGLRAISYDILKSLLLQLID